MAAPALKPSRFVSLMNATSELRRNAQASRLMPANTSAVSAASSAKRAALPPAMTATLVPTSIEIADVGPTASWRDVPNRA